MFLIDRRYIHLTGLKDLTGCNRLVTLMGGKVGFHNLLQVLLLSLLSSLHHQDPIIPTIHLHAGIIYTS